jgi:hypothetical protein
MDAPSNLVWPRVSRTFSGVAGRVCDALTKGELKSVMTLVTGNKYGEGRRWTTPQNVMALGQLAARLSLQSGLTPKALLRMFRPSSAFPRWAVSLCALVATTLQPASALEFFDEAERQTEIENLWKATRPKIEAYVDDPAKRAVGLDLYYLQMWTNELALYAIRRRITSIRDPLLVLCDKEIDRLVHATNYVFSYDPRAGVATRASLPLSRPTDLWLTAEGVESTLNSSQFVFHLASIARALMEARQLDEPTVRRVFDRIHATVAAHLTRWILTTEDRVFQMRGWGCQRGMYNHRELLEQKRLRAFREVRYCNALTDIDTWIIAAAAEFVATHRLSPEAAPLDRETADALAAYVREAIALLAKRTQVRKFYKADQGQFLGAVLDPGAYDDYPDHWFAGYTGDAYPSAKNAGPSGAGWDSSHGGRQVSVLLSLYETRGATGAHWPDTATLAAFARAFAFAVFEGDLKHPRLRNFLDGSNGWYKVNLRERRGYPPFGLTQALLYIPWGRYAAFEPEVGRIVSAVWRIVESDDQEDVDFRSRAFESPKEMGGTGVPTAAVRGASVVLFPLLTTRPLEPHP